MSPAGRHPRGLARPASSPPRPWSLLHSEVIAIEAPASERERSAAHRPDNLLDRLSRRSTLELNYRYLLARERELVCDRVGLTGGEVLSVGAGLYPGRHLFPAPAFRLVAVDADPERVAALVADGSADEAFVGQAGRLGVEPRSFYASRLGLEPRSFDVVLYRLVLHHIAYQGPLAPCFAEAAALLRPGGWLIAIEPGLWHPVGAALNIANKAGLATAVHGTPDDIPLSPRRLVGEARAAGLAPELYGVTYGWRRLPPAVQRAVRPLDRIGSRPRPAMFGHTLMLIARSRVR